MYFFLNLTILFNQSSRILGLRMLNKKLRLEQSLQICARVERMSTSENLEETRVFRLSRMRVYFARSLKPMIRGSTFVEQQMLNEGATC